MKAYFYGLFLLIAVVSFISCNNTEKKEEVSTDVVNNPATADGTADTSSIPVIKFVAVEHDFGQIIQGEKISFAFKFKNSGKSDLVIASANAGCGARFQVIPKIR